MAGSSHIPRVSIGLPVYNGERYLEETLNSVLRQTYTDFVVYISDNASTDKTEEICRQFVDQDSRIVYERHPKNIGAAGNYERSFLPAKSEFFRWQNADDPIEPTLIEKCLKVLDEHSDVVLAYGKTYIIDDNGNFVRKYDDNLALMQDTPYQRFKTCLENIRLQNLMYGLIRRDLLAQTARMKAYISADINLIAELTLYGKIYEVPEHLFNRRIHEESSSWDMKDNDTLQKFFNLSKKNLALQTWRNIYQYYKSINKSPILINQKISLVFYLLRYSFWRKNILTSELFECLQHKFGMGIK
ncbi:Glycosyltransferase involved in cell wall bisynthesis [Desulfuromusa kysingii]|uniref:Glycosyltransferase involved in cell wall bisynthesis n=1 Tax=Desulfuromusa kysingii TaxID=37625 RepID=A0A1H4BAS9_9BACT|nr:glycosyltransferase [Desulfuromusa kysingii]SEA45206.1 Glycosyltransferase involved in cell wall bisynthesis [Desulfuromusa kysingii]